MFKYPRTKSEENVDGMKKSPREKKSLTERLTVNARMVRHSKENSGGMTKSSSFI